MKENIGLEKNTNLIRKTGNVIKDHARLTKQGTAYYLDTLRKLPGAYLTSRDQINSDGNVSRRVRSIEDIGNIIEKIEGSKTKTQSIREWVNLALEGTWDTGVKKKIEDFGRTADKWKEKIELLEIDYKYFVDTFLDSHEDELSVIFNNRNNKKMDAIDKSLKQIDLIGGRVNETLSRIKNFEKDIEKFIDHRLSDSRKGRIKPFLRKKVSWIKKLMNTILDTAKGFIGTIKAIILGLYYMAGIFAFIVKYFIFIPAVLLKKSRGLFNFNKKK